MALWLRAPIETAKYSNEVPLGENSYRCGPVWSCPTTRKPTPYGRRPYSCVLTWASDTARQLRRRDGGVSGTRRTVGDGGYESVDGDGSVEYHFRPHGLLAHEITAWYSEQEVKKASAPLSARLDDFVREVGGTYLRTRASDVKPAIAMPTWSSMRNIFCWYDASSPLER